MRATLLCRTGELSGRTFPLTAETVIGRADGSNVVISSDLVSGRHASIRRDGTGYVLEDLGSSNGTWVDGERVTHPVRLDALNVISLAGAVDLIFHDAANVTGPLAPPAQARPAVDRASVPTPAAAQPAAAQPALVRPVAAKLAGTKPSAGKPAGPRPDVPIPAAIDPKATEFLQLTFGALPALERPVPPPEERGATVESRGITLDVSALSPEPPTGQPDGSTMLLDGPFDLPPLDSAAPTAEAVAYRLEINRAGLSTQTVELLASRRYTLGRSLDCDIPLDDAQLSRHHATITVGEVVMVEDAGSRNGTHMKGRRLVAPAVLAPGAAFMLASTVSVKLVAP